ncbi:unnamed protein product [Phytomonas sp. EM1]|nr:unnamed protein product [Phytomonas sp. EM1]|eukprot:CCW60417.1 unnamed protein product [Phytomonas sp. isolate EM1]
MNFRPKENGNHICTDNEDASVEELEESSQEDYKASRRQGSTADVSSNERDDFGEEGRELDGSDSSDTSSSTSGFSDDVELIIGETPTQSIKEPLVESDVGYHRAKRDAMRSELLLEGTKTGAPGLMIADRATPAATALTFLDAVAQIPGRLKNVALVGDLQHGKTSLLRMLLRGQGYIQYPSEKDRNISLKTHVLSSLMGGNKLHPSSQLITFVDTPGHPDLFEEAAAGLRLVDAALFCVDAVESFGAAGERLLRHLILREQLPVVLVITKVDRLIIDLKLPPLDAYRKLRLVVDAVNNVIVSCGGAAGTPENPGSRSLVVSPENGTVCFSSARLGLFFSLVTFSKKYSEIYPSVEVGTLSQCMWGQVTFHQGAFKRITSFRERPTFVTFILEPLYKVIAHSATGQGSQSLSKDLSALPRSPMTAIQEAVRYFCGDPSGEGLDALLDVLPSPEQRASWLGSRYGLNACFEDGEGEVEAEGPQEEATVAAIAPLFCVFNEDEVAAVVRVVRGTLRCATGRWGAVGRGELVVIDDYSSDVNPFYTLTPEKLHIRTVEGGFVAVEAAYAGQIVYLTKIDAPQVGNHLVLVGGSAVSALQEEERMLNGERDAHDAKVSSNHAVNEVKRTEWINNIHLKELSSEKPLVHVSLELKEPAKLQAFQHGLDILLRTSPGLDIHKEETGEYTFTGYGELHLDTTLYRLRRVLCPTVKLGISQPYVTFSETVLSEEGLLAVAGAQRRGVGFTCGTLPSALVSAIEYEELDFFPEEPEKVVKLWTTMRREYGFDALDAQHLMALGPSKTKGPSLLLDDTLEEELRHPIPATHRQAIIAGFRAATAAGPLIGGVVRGVAARLVLLEATPETRAPVVLANARAAVRQGLLGAQPRLLEPVLACEVLCAGECVQKLTEILRQRRGAVVGEEPIAATTLVRVRAVVPSIDSFGLETQIRMLTHGQAFPYFWFQQWDMVPGDPYDTTIRVHPLEPARGHQLARDFVLKTRFRKGLSLALTEES